MCTGIQDSSQHTATDKALKIQGYWPCSQRSLVILAYFFGVAKVGIIGINKCRRVKETHFGGT
jgi:hypothetical protein